MTKPVNLNRFRKDKARAAKKARADENAVSFGRTKLEKSVATTELDKQITALDQHKRDP